MKCGVCGTENVRTTGCCTGCGAVLRHVPDDSWLAWIFPYKNPPALIAYYLGVFSIIPVFGIILGITGLILGIKGIQRRSAQPLVHGLIHAWVGIGCGGVFALLWGSMVVMLLLNLPSSR